MPKLKSKSKARRTWDRGLMIENQGPVLGGKNLLIKLSAFPDLAPLSKVNRLKCLVEKRLHFNTYRGDGFSMRTSDLNRNGP